MESYIRHKIRKFDWYWSTHGCLAGGKSFPDTLTYRLAKGKYIRSIAFPYQHNPPKTGNLYLRDTLHIRRAWWDQEIDHERHLNSEEGTTNFDGGFQLEKHWLWKKYLSGFLAEGSDLCFQEFTLLSFEIEEFIDDIININFFCFHMEKC